MRYLIGALVVLALLFLAWWLFSRGQKQKLEEQRAEAARIRAGAQEREAGIRGQETFAQQAEERAALARHDAEERARQAEESAREAQRVEEEARSHQAELDRARLQRDAELRRADELDPDVEVDTSDPRPLPEDLDDHVRPLDEPVSERADARASRGGAVGGAAGAAAGAAALGSAYAASRGDVSDAEAQRLASGADYRDDTEWVAGGRHAHDDAAFAENSADGTTGRVEHAERQGHDMTHHDEGDARRADETAHDDVDATREGDEATRDDSTRDDSETEPGDGDIVIINDVEDYASTEPLPMDEQTPVDRTSDEPTTEDTWDADATADRDTETVRDSDTDRDRDSDSAADRDTDPDRDASTERVSDEDLIAGGTDPSSPSEDGDATHWPDGTERVNVADDASSDSGSDGDDSGSDEGYSGSGEGTRRTSEVDEIRDGGYGVGSAAPLEDRAQPRDHPVQAYRDTMTFRVPGSPGYDSAEPDVWFYDEDAARQAGFNPSEG